MDAVFETYHTIVAGDSLTGEAFVVPRDERDLFNRLEKAYEVANALDWRLHDVKIVPVRSLE